MKVELHHFALLMVNNAVTRDRIQQHAYLVHQECKPAFSDLESWKFKQYNDWIPTASGPFSKQLDHDLDLCLNDDTIRIYYDGDYHISFHGVARYEKIKKSHDVGFIDKKIAEYEKIKDVEIFGKIYANYPNMVKHASVDSIRKNGGADFLNGILWASISAYETKQKDPHKAAVEALETMPEKIKSGIPTSGRQIIMKAIENKGF